MQLYNKLWDRVNGDRRKARELLLGEYSDSYLEVETVLDAMSIIAGIERHEKVVYGLNVDELLNLSIRIRGRYWIESAFSIHASFIGSVIDQALNGADEKEWIVVDLFAGTGNLAFHVSESIKSRRTICCDSDAQSVSDMRHNFGVLGREIEVLDVAFPDSLEVVSEILGPAPQDVAILFIVDPPWGENGFQYGRGLDLRKTAPAVDLIIAGISRQFDELEYAIAVKTHLQVVEESFTEVFREWFILSTATTETVTPGLGPGVAVLMPIRS